MADDLTLQQLYAAAMQAEEVLSRKVNMTLYTDDEFQARLKHPDSFIRQVLAGQHVVLLGSTYGTATAG